MATLAWLQAVEGTSGNLYNIPPEFITVESSFNVRITTPELERADAELVASIRDQGFLRSRPLTIRVSGQTVLLRDGHRRLQAVKTLIGEGVEFKSLPCVPAPKGSEADDTLMILTSNNGVNHSPLEEAILISRLISYGWAEKDIAGKLGKSRAFVANRMDLLAAPDAVKELVKLKKLSATEAVRTIREEGPEKAQKTLLKAADASKSGKVTRKTVNAIKPTPVKTMSEAQLAIVAFLDAWDNAEEEKAVDDAVAVLRMQVAP